MYLGISRIGFVVQMIFESKIKFVPPKNFFTRYVVYIATAAVGTLLQRDDFH